MTTLRPPNIKSSWEVTLSRQGNLKSSHDFVGVLECVNHSLVTSDHVTTSSDGKRHLSIPYQLKCGNRKRKALIIRREVESWSLAKLKHYSRCENRQIKKNKLLSYCEISRYTNTYIHICVCVCVCTGRIKKKHVMMFSWYMKISGS